MGWSLAMITLSAGLSFNPLLSLALCPKGCFVSCSCGEATTTDGLLPCFPASLLPAKQGSREAGKQPFRAASLGMGNTPGISNRVR